MTKPPGGWLVAQARARLRVLRKRLVSTRKSSEVSGSLRGAAAKRAGGRKPKTIHVESVRNPSEQCPKTTFCKRPLHARHRHVT
eukprot:12460204-Alexandrium_andersonii.AAC.1